MYPSYVSVNPVVGSRYAVITASITDDFETARYRLTLASVYNPDLQAFAFENASFSGGYGTPGAGSVGQYFQQYGYRGPGGAVSRMATDLHE